MGSPFRRHHWSVATKCLVRNFLQITQPTTLASPSTASLHAESLFAPRSPLPSTPITVTLRRAPTCRVAPYTAHRFHRRLLLALSRFAIFSQWLLGCPHFCWVVVTSFCIIAATFSEGLDVVIPVLIVRSCVVGGRSVGLFCCLLLRVCVVCSYLLWLS